MRALLFFHPILDALSRGRVIRMSVGIGLRILAILSLLGGLWLLVEILKFSFQLPTEGTIGGLLFAVVSLATTVAVAQIFWYRAETVTALSESPFTVIPIVSILFRTAGEVYAALGASVGVGGCVFIWLAGFDPLRLLGGVTGLLPRASAEATFLGGISFLLYMSLTAFFVLVVFYFLAESSLVLVDIAQHVRLSEKRGTHEPSTASLAAPRCPSCSTVVEAVSRFCGYCGARLAGQR